jgi:amino acid transporter
MAVAGALPRVFSRIHPRYLTPAFGTIVVGSLATLWYVPGKLISENFLFDSLSALSLMIAFYYGLTGIACAVYWRRELLRSAKNLLFIGVAPLIGAAMLFYLLYESIGDLSEPRGVVQRHRGARPRRAAGDRARVHARRRRADAPVAAARTAAGKEFFARRPFEHVPHDIAAGGGKVEAIGVSEEAADTGAVR